MDNMTALVSCFARAYHYRNGEPHVFADSVAGQMLTAEEYDAVVDHLLALGLEDGFVQELSSSDEKYIPAFDLTGVERPE